MKRSQKSAFLGFAALGIMLSALLFGTSCSSLPESTPDDEMELVQLAQTAYDSGNTRLAKFYYSELLEKFGDNPSIYVEGRFELAHIAIKKKQYETAVPILEEIEEIYNNLPPGVLPGEYRKLAQLDLEKVPKNKLEAIHKKMQEKEEKALLQNKAAAEQEETALQTQSSREPDAGEESETLQKSAGENED